jgi:hypothetical protein
MVLLPLKCVHAELTAVCPSKSRNILRVAPGRECRLKAWALVRVGVMAVSAVWGCSRDGGDTGTQAQAGPGGECNVRFGSVQGAG